MAACGIRVDALVAAGGGAKSARWLQLKADILNRPVRTLRCGEAACLGAAMLAGTAVGAYATLDQAVAQAVQLDREFLPVPDRVSAYAERYATYQQLYPLREGAEFQIMNHAHTHSTGAGHADRVPHRCLLRLRAFIIR